jgi:UDP-N-acetylglucosamine transferase subunit ALG13
LNKNQNILICPLEWGLGHASRMIPLARKLKSMGHKIIIAAGDGPVIFLRKEMPEMDYVLFPGFTIRYSGKLPQYLVIMLKIPLLFYHSIREHQRLKKIIGENEVDIVISDSRIGLWNSRIKSVIVLHFPRIPLPVSLSFLERPLISLGRFIISKFTFCFIPDLDGEDNLTGRLSHDLSLPSNSRFIGILSRFTRYADVDCPIPGKYHFMVMLSGPEPQREILKNKLYGYISGTGEKAIFLGGYPEPGYKEQISGNITFINHLPEREMAELILASDLIITRSGYTTIMELVSLNKSALIIPTPGQTEQEYLARYLSNKGLFSTVHQSEIRSMDRVNVPDPVWPERINEQSEVLLHKAIVELLEK